MTGTITAHESPPAWRTLVRALLERGAKAGHGEPGLRHTARRNALIAFFVRVASAGLLYLTQIVLARWMGEFEYGVFILVWTWVLVLGGLSHLGIGMAMMRLLPQYTETGHLVLARGLLRAGRMFPLLFSTTIALAGLGGLMLLGDAINHHFVLPAYLALVCLPIFTLAEVQDGIGRGHGWISAALVPNYVLRPLIILLGMIAAHEVGLPMVAATAVAIAIAATWAATAVQTILLNRRLRAVVGAGERHYDYPAWIRAALPLLAVSAAELAMQNIDVLALSRFATPADVAVYFAAAKSMSLVLFIHYAVGSAAAGGLAALNARGDRAALTSHIRDAVNWTFWPSLAVTVGILLIGKPLLSLFGPRFVEGYPVMLILSIGILGRAAVGPAEFTLNMLGEQIACACAAIAAACLNLMLQLTLVPSFGARGAATATATAMLTAAALHWGIARWRLRLDLGVWSHFSLAKAGGT
jgi:O-antigen/teichoic acid export membrane protein